jgi:phosphoribosylformylglycinamidine synthase
LGTIEDFEHAPSRAFNPGDYVVLMGGSTGRDGIHGVTFASRTLTEMSEADRPAVQIGDPFTKKMIIEATLEAIKTGYVRGLKDLGGGGLTCATSELTGDGNTGAEIQLRKVFTREPGMTSYEIMLSESQERMAFIVKPDGLESVLDIFRKYEMTFAVIGRTNDSQVLKVFDEGNLVVNIPSKALAESPTFKREERRPKYLDDLLAQTTPNLSLTLEEIIYNLIASENICSKEWIYRQYDHEVGVRSVVKCGEGDSGVLRIIGTNKFIAASVGVNSKHCFLDPYEGAKGGLVEVCGNVIANGAKPMAMVNCCNFGNPEIPESFWYFSKAVDGMNEFCRSLKIPIVGGNVSFYNEDEVTKTAIKATPEIMIVGIIEGEENIITLPFKDIDNDIWLIGETKAELGGSEYHSVIYNIEGGNPPKVNEEKIKAIWDFIFELYSQDLVKSNHDINKGGIIITIAEMCFKNNLGANINFNNTDLQDDEFLFSESVGRFIIETNPKDYDIIRNLAKQFKVDIRKIGTIISTPKILITGIKSDDLNIDLNKMKMLYDSTIPDLMDV